MKRFISLILSFATVLCMAAEGIPYCFKPTLAVDAGSCAGEVSSVSQKVVGGSVKFNETASFTPHIYSVSVNGASE